MTSQTTRGPLCQQGKFKNELTYHTMDLCSKYIVLFIDGNYKTQEEICFWVHLIVSYLFLDETGYRHTNPMQLSSESPSPTRSHILKERFKYSMPLPDQSLCWLYEVAPCKFLLIKKWNHKPHLYGLAQTILNLAGNDSLEAWLTQSAYFWAKICKHHQEAKSAKHRPSTPKLSAIQQ